MKTFLLSKFGLTLLGVLLLLGGGSLAVLLLVPIDNSPVSGPAHVIDGDTVVVAGETHHLIGINAPEADETCTYSRSGGVWPCGAKAKEALSAYLEGRIVTCETTGYAGANQTVLSHCTSGSDDLSTWLVRQGWAVVDESAPQPFNYALYAKSPKAIGFGIWASDPFQHR